MKNQFFILSLCIILATLPCYAAKKIKNKDFDLILQQNNFIFPSNKKLMFTESIAKYGTNLNNPKLSDIILENQKQNYIRSDEFYTDIPELKPFFTALEKFKQSNVNVAYKEFNAIVVDDSLNDFQYIIMAYKLSEIGLFNLAEISLNKILNQSLWKKQIKSIKASYFPRNKLSYDNELFLANTYAAISYNNLTRESISDLRKKSKKNKKSDYTNYLIASAFYKERQYPKAIKAINKAISLNPKNINYLKFKTRILCENKNYKEALKLVKIMDSKNIELANTTREIKRMKYFILSKLEKDKLKAKYYLAYYMYLNNDYNRAIDELSLISSKNKLPEASNLLAKIYFINKNYKEATAHYKNTLSINKKYSSAYKGLGDICLIKNDYTNALTNYEKAYKYNKKDIETLIILSIMNNLLNNDAEAEKYCEKADKLDKNHFKVSYLKSKLYKGDAEIYLNKTLSENPFYCNAWLDLANIEINNKQLGTAKTYLNSSKYIENDNYRYYYYTGLIAKNNENNTKAENNFKNAIILYNKNVENKMAILQNSEDKN